MKTLIIFAFITLLTASMSSAQTSAPKPPAAASNESKAEAEVAGSITAQLVIHSARLRAASDRFGTAKVTNFASAKTKADIATRRKLVEEYVAASKSVDAFCDGLEKTIRTELTAKGVSNAAAEKSVVEYMTGFKKTAQITKEIRNAERTSISTVGEIYGLLDAEWGNWSADKKGMLLFKKKAALDKLNALHKTIKDAYDKQEAAEKRLAAIRAKK